MSRTPGLNARLVLPPPPEKYDPADQREVRRLIQLAMQQPASYDAMSSVPAPVSALGGLTGAADNVPYFTSASAMALAALTPYARTIIACATAAAMRTLLGLGTPSDATKFLNGAAVPVFAQVKGSDLAMSDVTTNDVSILAHGFTPKAPNDTTKFLRGDAAYAQVKGADLLLSDVTTNDVSITEHGFAPKAPNDTTKFLRGDASYAQVKGADLSMSDVTTNNVGITQHGFAPKAPNDATKYLDGTGAWSAPAGGSAAPTFPAIANAMFGWDSILSQTDLTSLGYASKMYDISGNGRHSDTNTTNPPKWVQHGFNRGYPAIYFNGGNKMTISALPGLGSPLACTIVFVVQNCLITSGNCHIYNWSGNPIGFGGTNTPLDLMYNGTVPPVHPLSAETKNDVPPDITGYPVVGIHVYNGASSINSLNNNEQSVSPGTAATGSTNWFTIGSDSTSGIGGGTASTCKMLLRAFWVFNHVCTPAERASLLAYYAHPLIAGIKTP